MDFTTPQVLKIFGLNRNGFKDWLARGYIKPSIQESRRQGEKNVFAHEDLYLIGIFQKMITLGFLRLEAARFIEELNKERNRRPWAKTRKYECVIFKRWLEGDRILASRHLIWSETGNIDPLKKVLSKDGMDRSPDCSIVLNIGRIMEEVDKKIDQSCS